MQLTFLGAAHEVTGSCFFLQACGKNILIDCGMEQGPDEYQNQQIPVNASQIDKVLLTHAHIDHSGCLPLLYAKGFRGTVYTTEATNALCEIMLRDSAHIQMFEAEWRNRKGKRAGKEEYVPLYNMDDAIGIMKHFRGCSYGERFEVEPGITVRFTDAGHLLGSASIEIWVEEEGIEKKIVFSGDIGNQNQSLIRNPQYVENADYVIMESTYGTRTHGKRGDYIGELAKVIQKTFDRGGNLVIPSFAVGRTQELLYHMRKIKEEGLVTGHGNFPVYVDSPLAIEATHIFGEHMEEYFDEETLKLVHQGINPIGFPDLKLSVTSDDSKAINFEKENKVIISASGMCEAGRIKHHLKHNLWRPESTILFAGYQAVGTLGRNILEGATHVNLFGETIEIHAEIRSLEGISGHADHPGLLQWINHFNPRPQRVFIVHGADEVCDAFAKELQEVHGYHAEAPYTGAVYDLRENRCVQEGVSVKLKKKSGGKNGNNGTTVYDRLQAAGDRLMEVIKHNQGGANKDLAKFIGQINSLCDKWDR